MTAYAEFRSSYEKDEEDERIVFFGIRYVIENYINKKWTMEDLDRCGVFYSTHKSGYTNFPFPRDLFKKFIEQNDGYFPVTIEALKEGSVIYPHIPVYQITAKDEYSPLVTFLETLLTMVWYPSTVATLSRRMKNIIEEGFLKSVDEDGFFLLHTRLHDFGFRGCTCVEQSIIGGTSHLLNFIGSDTSSASYYAQFYLNNGKPIAQSIPATEVIYLI
jgi:nicotinic acid phosphoribosyltransferase